MRICHIITTLVYGGAERLLVNFTHLQARDHEIHVVYLKGEPVLAAEFHPSVRIHFVPLAKAPIRSLRRLLRELAPDIVHTHLGHADFLGPIASTGLPVRRFCTMHNIWFKWNRKDWLFFAAYRVLFKTLARGCMVICISECVADHVRRRLGVPARLAKVVYNGIPDIRVEKSREALRADLGIGADRFCVLFVGRFRLQKSVDTLLDAVAGIRPGIPALEVILIGEGEERARLEAQRARLGLEDCVRFEGTTAHPERYFACADLFVLPSVFEGLGIVVLEAFRAGCPVIATRIEGPRELIRDGENGLLVEPRRPDDLGAAILSLHRDPARRARLAKAGRDGFSSRFTIKGYADELDRLYRGVFT